MQIPSPAPLPYLTFFDLLQRLTRMSSVYWSEAWPFAIGHIAVLVSCVWPIREILAESRALRMWRENDEGTTECTRVLHEFVEETRLWGAQGTLVPMTDFTDRLDSKTTGLIDNLHSRVNLFLMLGIAGTFFAMFQFATDAGAQLPKGMATIADAERAGQNVAQILARNLSLAFPVGFFGLMLAVIGHFVAFRIDRRLRSAMTVACQRAMLFRRQSARDQAVSLAEALRPLGNLHETMRNGIGPVFEGLRAQLEGTAAILKEQVAPLASAVARFEIAAGALTEPARALTAAAAGLPGAMKHVEEMQTAEREHLARLQETEDSLRETIEQAANNLQAATKGLADLPLRLSGDFSTGIANMREDAANLWTDQSKALFDRLDPAAEAVDRASRSLSAAAGSLSALPADLSRDVQHELTHLTEETVRLWLENGAKLLESIRPVQEVVITAMRQLEFAAAELSGTPGNIAATFKIELTELVRDATRIWKENSAAFVNEFRADLQERLALIRNDSAKASENLGIGAQKLTEAASTVTEVVKNAMRAQSEAAVRELQPLLERLDEAIVLRYPEALKNLAEAATNSGNLATHAGSATSAMKSILADIQASERQLADARIDVEKSIAEFRRGPGTSAPHTPDLRPEIERVRQAIGDLTNVVRERNLWSQLFPFRRNGGRTPS